MCSGANMDFDRLRFVSERADSSETLISATIPERPGAFQVRLTGHGVTPLRAYVIFRGDFYALMMVRFLYLSGGRQVLVPCSG